MTTENKFLALLSDFEKTINSFEELLNVDLSQYSALLSDGIENGQIQKFEICVELSWKVGQIYLSSHHQIVANSPKSVYKQLFNQFVIDEETCSQLIEMADDRNKLSHVYEEKVMQSVIQKLPHYVSLLKILLAGFKK